MAKQSKAKAYTAQLKRQNRQLINVVERSQQTQAQATALVLGCLVQAGGDITFSEATTATMNKDIARMGYKIVPDAESRVKVCLIYQDAVNDEQLERDLAQGKIPEPVKQWNGDAVGKILLTD